jgi:hypothetical protein
MGRLFCSTRHSSNEVLQMVGARRKVSNFEELLPTDETEEGCYSLAESRGAVSFLLAGSSFLRSWDAFRSATVED